MKRYIGSIVVCCVAISALAIWSSKAGEPVSNTVAADVKELEGKWIGLETDRALERHGSWLHNTHVQSIGGEPFLVGTSFSVDGDGKAADHCSVYVALRHIEQMFVFESIDELKKLYEKK